MLRARVERRRLQRIEKLRQPAHRIVGELRIGGVALRPLDDERGRKAAAPADLDLVAELAARWSARRRARAVKRSPRSAAQSSSLAVPLTAGALLVAGDQEREPAAEIVAAPARRSAARRRPSRRARPSCRPRRGRRARRRRSPPRTADAASAPRRRAARRRHGRRASGAARPCRSRRRDSRPARVPGSEKTGRSTAKPAGARWRSQHIERRASHRRDGRRAHQLDEQVGRRPDVAHGHAGGPGRRMSPIGVRPGVPGRMPIQIVKSDVDERDQRRATARKPL